MIHLATHTLDALRAFATSSSLKQAAWSVDVVGEPEVVPRSPHDDGTVRVPAAAAVEVHDVADSAAWKSAFDQDDATRKRASVIAHAVNPRAPDRLRAGSRLGIVRVTTTATKGDRS